MTPEMTPLPGWIYRQSAALPYRQGPDGLEVLLVTSRKGSRWVLPKGIVDPGLTPPQSAAKEAREEAGVEGQIGSARLGRYRYRKWGGTCRVEVFPMKVGAETDDWPEAGLRQRQWLGLAEAAQRVKRKQLGKIIGRLPDALEDMKRAKPAATQVDPGRLIYLFRHAKSSWAEPDLADFRRPLAPRGKRALDKMRDYMELADVAPDLVLCSPAARTRHSLAGVLPAFDDGVQVKLDPRIYRRGQRGLLKRLQRLPGALASVMVIGHNPALQELALQLTGEGDAKALARMRRKFPTGALATLVWRGGDWAELGPGSCELHSFVIPRQL